VDDGSEPRDVGFSDLDEQLVLVADVVIERRLRDAARLGDLVHRRRRVAAPREQACRATEDLLALLVVAVGTSAGHVSARPVASPATNAARSGGGCAAPGAA